MKYVVITDTDGESFTEPRIIRETELDYVARRTDEITAGNFSVHVICHFTHPPSPISYTRKSLQELSDSDLVNLAVEPDRDASSEDLQMIDQEIRRRWLYEQGVEDKQ